MSLDPITDAQQTHNSYWSRIKDQFNKRENYGEFAKMHMDRNDNAMPHRWKPMQEVCNQFHGDLPQVRGTNASGETMEDNLNAQNLFNFTYSPSHLLVCVFLFWFVEGCAKVF